MMWNHRIALASSTAAAKRIVDRYAKVDFTTEGPGQYGLVLRFDTQMCPRGASSREDMQFLAKMVAQQVEAEIATCRFMASAQELEWDLLERARGRLSDEP